VSFLFEWEDGDGGEGSDYFTAGQTPKVAAQESGTGATRQSRRLRTADGFAV